MDPNAKHHLCFECVWFKGSCPDSMHSALKSRLDNEFATSAANVTTKSSKQRPKPIIHADVIRRVNNLHEMKGDSGVAQKSEDKTLKLDDWTKAANKNDIHSQNKGHFLSSVFCLGGAMSLEWLEHLICTAIALAVQLIFGHPWAFPGASVLDIHGSACGNFCPNNAALCNECRQLCLVALPSLDCQEWLQRDDPCGGFEHNASFCYEGATPWLVHFRLVVDALRNGCVWVRWQFERGLGCLQRV